MEGIKYTCKSWPISLTLMETQLSVVAPLLRYRGKNYLKGEICMEITWWVALSNLAPKLNHLYRIGQGYSILPRTSVEADQLLVGIIA
jgi:hypothetical protein